MLKKIYNFYLAATIFILTAGSAQAASVTNQMSAQNGKFLQLSGFAIDTSISDIAAVIIETVLGLLGIIFVVLLIFAGFQWMTAEGNEEKVEKAKQTIVRAIIGLAIVIAAYSITFFVFNALSGSANNGANLPG